MLERRTLDCANGFWSISTRRFLLGNRRRRSPRKYFGLPRVFPTGLLIVEFGFGNQSCSNSPTSSSARTPERTLRQVEDTGGGGGDEVGRQRRREHGNEIVEFNDEYTAGDCENENLLQFGYRSSNVSLASNLSYRPILTNIIIIIEILENGKEQRTRNPIS